MAVKDYSTNPDENTTISGINIAEGCAPSGINNAIRQLMADVRQNADEQAGVNKSLATTVMTGATEEKEGKVGLVPAPAAGEQNKPLTGGGNYADSLDCDISGHAAKDLPLTGGIVTGNVTVTQKLGIDGNNLIANLDFENAPGCTEICRIDAYNERIRFYGSKTQNSASINIKTGQFEGVLTGYASNAVVANESSLAYSIPNVFMARSIYSSGGVTIPQGGTWRCCAISEGEPVGVGYIVQDLSGGSIFNQNYGTYAYVVIAIRIA